MAATSDLRDLDDGGLIERLAEMQEELFNLRFQNATGQLDNYTRLGGVKRDIARVRTVIRQREIEAAESSAEEPNDE